MSPAAQQPSNFVPSTSCTLDPSFSVPAESWHPKLTGYRLLVVALTAGFGSAKAIITYRGQSTASTTLEWVFGVVVFLGLYFLGLYEKNTSHTMPWLFDKDYALYLLSLCSCPVPAYRTDERTVMPVNKRHPPLTGYRLLVSVTAIAFGLTKAILTYTGHSTAPTAIDWISGLVLTITLYWLGLYESNSVGMMPALFDTDYTPVVMGLPRVVFFVFFVLVCAFIAYFTGRLTYRSFRALVDLWNTEATNSGSDSPPPSIFETMFLWSEKALGTYPWIFVMMMGCFVTLAMIAPLAISTAFLVVSIARVPLFYIRLLVTHLKHRFWANAFNNGEAQLSDCIAPTLSPFVAHKKIWKKLRLGLLILVYIIGHAVAMLLCVAWTMVWLYPLVEIWMSIFKGGHGSIWEIVLLASFLIFWSAGACFAIFVGLAGGFIVLVSLLNNWGYFWRRGFVL